MTATGEGLKGRPIEDISPLPQRRRPRWVELRQRARAAQDHALAALPSLSRRGPGRIIASVSRQPPLDSAPPEWGASTSAPQRSRTLSFLGELLQTLLIAFLLFFAVDRATARIRVDGNSMEPSLHDGDLVVVNRLAYALGQPSRGDIIVFYFPFDPQKRYIKRLIGLPGDQIAARGGQLYVNGTALYEPYTSGESTRDGSWLVGPSEVFVLGDNRANSSDSSDWGMVPLREVIGKAVLVYWPPQDVGVIPHYDLMAGAGPP